MAAIQGSHIPAAAPLVTNLDTPYIAGTMVAVAPSLPDTITKTRITLTSSQRPSLNEIATLITEKTGIPVSVDLSQKTAMTLPGLPGQSSGISIPLNSGSNRSADMPMGIAFKNGTVKQLLDYIQANKNCWWKFRNGEIYIFRNEVKTFTLPIVDNNLASNFDIEASAGGALGNTQVGGQSGSTNTTNNATGSMSIKNKAVADLWENVQNTAKILAGSSSSVSVDPQMSTLTVAGTPPQIERVSKWVDQVDEEMGKQVAIVVHVYNVQLNNEQNYGFNPSGVFNQLTKQYGFTMTGAPAPTITSGKVPFSLSAFLGNTKNPAFQQFSGSTMAVQALATMGKVSETFERSLVTMNGQPAPIQVALNTGYLAESTSSATANVGVSNGLIPGNITTGFTAIFTPHIVNSRILLGWDMSISSLVSLQTESSGSSSIEVPTSTNNAFEQSVALKPGQTLLLTGYKQHNSNVQDNGVGSPLFNLLGGGRDATNSNQMIAITISARILNQ